MGKIYCISGLGADHRVFRKLAIPGYELVGVPWLPAAEGDTLASYAARIFRTIPEQDPVVLGLSFGGMLTTEIKKQFHISRAIIVSSAKTRSEIGYRSAFLKWVSGKRVLPDAWFVFSLPATTLLAGARSKEDSDLIRQMKREGRASLNRWMVDALLNWNNHEAPERIIHIHGTSDNIIRPGYVSPTHWIKGGSHFMIYNMADEVSRIISEELSEAEGSAKKM